MEKTLPVFASIAKEILQWRLNYVRIKGHRLFYANDTVLSSYRPKKVPPFRGVRLQEPLQHTVDKDSLSKASFFCFEGFQDGVEKKIFFWIAALPPVTLSDVIIWILVLHKSGDELDELLELYHPTAVHVHLLGNWNASCLVYFCTNIWWFAASVSSPRWSCHAPRRPLGSGPWSAARRLAPVIQSHCN